MNRCILMYFERGTHPHQKDVWFETFGEALAFARNEAFAWKCWQIHHIGTARIMAQSYNS